MMTNNGLTALPQREFDAWMVDGRPYLDEPAAVEASGDRTPERIRLRVKRRALTGHRVPFTVPGIPGATPPVEDDALTAPDSYVIPFMNPLPEWRPRSPRALPFPHTGINMSRKMATTLAIALNEDRLGEPSNVWHVVARRLGNNGFLVAQVNLPFLWQPPAATAVPIPEGCEPVTNMAARLAVREFNREANFTPGRLFAWALHVKTLEGGAS